MEVVAHDHVGVQPPLMALTPFSECHFERTGGPDGPEHVATIVSTVDHVVKCVGVF